MGSTHAARSYAQLQLALEKNEVFGVFFLNSQNNLIAFEKLFFGSINSASVHPRVVVQKTLEKNASAVILVHNHPGGNAKPR
jgi:DNA repair protein RadC